jgi:hypothetical protein
MKEKLAHSIGKRLMVVGGMTQFFTKAQGEYLQTLKLGSAAYLGMLWFSSEPKFKP